MPTDIYTTPLLSGEHIRSILPQRGSFDTDPQRTQELWELVASVQAPAMPIVSASTTNKDSLRPHSAPHPGSPLFASVALAPRGIVVKSTQFRSQTAFAYFATMEPAPAVSRAAHYQRLPTLRHTNLWLDVDAVANIASRYESMAMDGHLQQQEWVVEALDSLMRSEGRILPRVDDSWLPVRLCGESFEPSPESMLEPRWEEPPILHPRRDPAAPTAAVKVSRGQSCKSTSKPVSTTAASAPETVATATLSTTPTLSYWLWAGGFLRPATSKAASGRLSSPGAFAPHQHRNPSMRLDGLAGHTPLRHKRACLPYLSVDVLASGEPDEDARRRGRDRLAACGAVALWNRWRVRRKAGRDADADTDTDTGALRHFGMLLLGVSYEIWCLAVTMPAGDDGRGGGGSGSGSGSGWRGCEMRKVAGGSLVDRDELAELVDWINEIHRWGNTVYADACVGDVWAAEERE